MAAMLGIRAESRPWPLPQLQMSGKDSFDTAVPAR
jgi:hypothetical protein